jgi:uncharacterized protein
VLPVVASHEQNIRQYVADEKGIDARTINAVRVLKRSIDARQRTIFVNLTVRVYINEMPQDDEYVKTEYSDVSSKPAACRYQYADGHRQVLRLKRHAGRTH